VLKGVVGLSQLKAKQIGEKHSSATKLFIDIKIDLFLKTDD